MARTGLVYRKECLLHDAGPGHPECPARLKAVLKAFDEAKLNPPRISVTPAAREDLLRVHSKEHVATIEHTCAMNAPYSDPDTSMVKASWPAALLAAGGAISACEAVLDGKVDNAFVVIRPPGHHAERDRAMGFCLFNNIAVAARWLQGVRNIGRIAILDWDVHHGNGTQHAFYEDENVYYASLHQYPLYPGTGKASEHGIDNTNLNVPMTAGSGPREWLNALDTSVVPEFVKFKPDFLLISAGFDAHRLNPLAGQNLESETYGEMTRRLGGLAQGRIVSVLEGGYHLEALGESAMAHFRALETLG